MATYFIIPGLGNSDENHWQTHFENSGENFIRINQKSWDEPDCEDWVLNIEKAVSTYEPSNVVLIAHMFGLHGGSSVGKTFSEDHQRCIIGCSERY